MKRFVLLPLLVLSSVQALPSFGPKTLTVAVSVDMTGAQSVPGYQKTARLLLESLIFRELKKGDTLTIYRVCNYTSTVTSFKLPKLSTRDRIKKAKSLAISATEPCKGKGSSITKSLKMMRGNQVAVVFTDGGLADDPNRDQFKAAAAQLLNKDTQAIWFGGLSNQRAGQSSLRDALAAQLPRDRRIITSGLNDVQSGFSQLTKMMKKARR